MDQNESPMEQDTPDREMPDDIIGEDSPSREPALPDDNIYYNMNNPRRGTALIFNHYEFNTNTRDRARRLGTSKDRDSLENCFKKLNFCVKTFEDLKYNEIIQVLHKVSTEDHSDCDCFVLCVLTHGGDGGLLCAKDFMYNAGDLWAPFYHNSCPSLEGKPKLFFIQACRGTQLDPGVRIRGTDASPTDYKCLVHPDILIAYSTFQGHYSFRNTEQGSYFVRALCDELNENGYEYDLLTLLTIVNRRLAIDFESKAKIEMYNQKKQVPQINVSFTRIFKFIPANS